MQHRIVQNARLVHDLLIVRGGAVFISGSAKQMPADVYDALRQVVQAVEGVGHDDAARTIATLRRTGRIVTEAW